MFAGPYPSCAMTMETPLGEDVGALSVNSPRASVAVDTPADGPSAIVTDASLIGC